jgi:carboxyl-terminal processing protease
MLSDLVAMGVKAGVDYDQEGFERAVPLMKMVIKGLIGRDVYENQTYSKVYNQYDDIFQAALAIIESKEYETLLKGDK